MKVGIVGVGAVGTACAKAMVLRGSCHVVTLVDLDVKRARGVATDISHGGVLCPATHIRSGDYADLADAHIVAVCAGINEQAGGAVDRGDRRGRLLLLEHNADVFADVVPRIQQAAPHALILVVTDPPDPLADVARGLTNTNGVLSAGTLLDSLRFRLQIARKLGCHPASVDAMVIGEHGTSQVYVWSSAQVGGESVLTRVEEAGHDVDEFRTEIEKAVKFANIDIIEGTGASQHGIGVVTARIVEAVLRDEGYVAPVGVFQERFQVTLSLPSILGRSGVTEVLKPQLSEEEERGLSASAAAIRAAGQSLRWTGPEEGGSIQPGTAE